MCSERCSWRCSERLAHMLNLRICWQQICADSQYIYTYIYIYVFIILSCCTNICYNFHIFIFSYLLFCSAYTLFLVVRYEWSPFSTSLISEQKAGPHICCTNICHIVRCYLFSSYILVNPKLRLLNVPPRLTLVHCRLLKYYFNDLVDFNNLQWIQGILHFSFFAMNPGDFAFFILFNKDGKQSSNVWFKIFSKPSGRIFLFVYKL